jgi:hypothetical protein
VVEHIAAVAGGTGIEVEECMGIAFEEDNHRMGNTEEQDSPSKTEDIQEAAMDSSRGCLETFRTGCRRSGSRRCWDLASSGWSGVHQTSIFRARGQSLSLNRKPWHPVKEKMIEKSFVMQRNGIQNISVN